MTEIVFLITILLLALVNAIYIHGLYAITDYEENNVDSRMLLWRLREKSIRAFGEFWAKPLFGCVTCMSSVHSTYILAAYIGLAGHDWIWLLAWPLYAVTVAGVVKLINR